jgi:hypothetical protein
MKYTQKILIISLLSLSMACAGTARHIIPAARRCPINTFDSYSNCLHGLVLESRHIPATRLQRDIPYLQQMVRLGKIEPRQAYQYCQTVLNDWYRDETTGGPGAAFIAIGAVAAMAVAAVYVAKKSGGGSSGFSYSGSSRNLAGCCSYHQGVYLTPENNHVCVESRILCNDNTRSPTCPC